MFFFLNFYSGKTPPNAVLLQLDITLLQNIYVVENVIIYLYLVARFENRQYELFSGYHGYEAIYVKVTPRKNSSKGSIIATIHHSLMTHTCCPKC